MRGLQLLIYLILLVQELKLMASTAVLCRSLLAVGSCTDYLLISCILLLTSGG
jgi:hypothetical protein